MAAKIKNRILTEKEVSQKINVSDILGVDVSGRPGLMQEFGQAVIDRIIERTESGKDINGKQFAKYSKPYIESEDFKEFDKSASEINLTLRGNMLASIEDEVISGSEIKVSVGEGVESAKAFNISTADTYKDKSKKRDFFGVTSKELNEIKREFSAEINEIKRNAVSTSRLDQEKLDLETVLFAERKTSQSIFNSIFGDQFDDN